MQDKIQEIMGLVSHAMDRAMWAGELILDEDRVHFERRFEEANAARALIESKIRELVREQEEAKKYADMLAMCMFEKHYAQDEPYSSGAVKFELFDRLPGVISQIDNMASGLERANNITNTSGVE